MFSILLRTILGARFNTPNVSESVCLQIMVLLGGVQGHCGEEASQGVAYDG